MVGQKPEKLKLSPEEQKREDKIMAQAAPLMLDFAQATQPGYFAPDELYRKIQMQAITETPLQQEMKRIAKDSLDELARISGGVERMAEKMGIDTKQAARAK
jgi:hypothetical protein